jgi:PST family polysaccharide transporter
MERPASTARDPFAVLLEADGLRRRSLHGSVQIFALQLVKLFIQVGSQMLLARLLFPADFGLVAMVAPLANFVGIFADIGLGQAIIQRKTLNQPQVSALFWLTMAMSCALVVIVAAIAPLAALAYREPRVVPLMLMLGAMIPISALGVSPDALLSRQMRFGRIAFNELLSLVASLVVTSIGALNGWSYWSLVAGQFAGTVSSSILAWTACGWMPSLPAFTASSWADLKFGGNIAGANLATFATTAGDNIIVAIMAGQVALGLYDRSYRLVVQPLNQIMAPVSRVAVPLLSRLEDRPDEYLSTYMRLFRAMLLLPAPAMLACIVDGHTIIKVILGLRWIHAAPIFSWICVGGLASGVYSSGYWLLISQGKVAELRRFTIIAALINLASFLVGAAWWGVVGVAALGALGFVGLTTPLMLYSATRTGPIPFRRLASYGAGFATQSGAVCAILLFVKSQLAIQGLLQIAVVGALAYILTFAFALLRRGDRELFWDVWKSASGMLKR